MRAASSLTAGAKGARAFACPAFTSAQVCNIFRFNSRENRISSSSQASGSYCSAPSSPLSRLSTSRISWVACSIISLSACSRFMPLLPCRRCPRRFYTMPGHCHAGTLLCRDIAMPGHCHLPPSCKLPRFPTPFSHTLDLRISRYGEHPADPTLRVRISHAPNSVNYVLMPRYVCIPENKRAIQVGFGPVSHRVVLVFKNSDNKLN